MDITPDAQELKSLLCTEGVAELINMSVDEAADGCLSVQIMAVSLDRLGAALAVLSRPEELEDEHSLSSRITNVDRPGHWQYKLTLTRYPIDRSLVFLVAVLLPASDLPEVVSRLRG
jgi:hypothetical protein